MTADPPDIYLGTVAIEPNRWGEPIDGRRSSVDVAALVEPIESAGFDGIELWEPHFVEASPVARETLAPRTAIYNSYVSLDDPDPATRAAVAANANQTVATGLKYNVGNDASAESAYADRIAEWLDELDTATRLLCECHFGISIAEDPATAARIFDAAGPPSRVQAIVHTHDAPDLLRQKFDAYGDRISHVHVNHLPDPTALRDLDELDELVGLLRSLGFSGTWTIEFTKSALVTDATADRLLGEATDDLATLRTLVS